MSSPAPYTFKQLVSEIITALAASISERHGETPEQKADRFRLATQMILAFFPRDVVEIVLTSRVVLFHELTLDSARELLRGQTPPMQRSTRANIVALDRCFHANLGKLEHYQTRRSDGERDAAEDQRPPATPTQTAPEPSPARQSNARSDQPARSAPIRPSASTNWASDSQTLVPPPEAVAALARNEAALEALAANDPIAFAKAMGIENPSNDPAAAAAQWADLFTNLAETEELAKQEPIAAE
jgi:hypothetical protein